MEGVNFWDEVINTICSKYSSPIKQQWIKSSSANLNNNTVTITAPNKMVKDFLNQNINIIKDLVDQIMLSNFNIEISIADNNQTTSNNPNVVPIAYAINQNPTLNIRYSFDNFIVGSSNQFTYTAAKALSEDLNQKYNPLFIFGESGLGKTHLMHAIGNNIVNKFPNKRVIYLKSEKFVSEFVDSIRFKNMDKFRKKYRKNLDVLLIDDIQFFSGKEQTQEELFHTISNAKQNNKIVVLTSDKQAEQIDGLDNRIKTRLSGGLVCDIKAPELETRIAIIKAKAKELEVDISDSVASFIAANNIKNVRELEGTITRICAFSSFSGIEITEDLIKELELKYINNNTETKVDVNNIIKIVANFYNLSYSDIIGNDKKQEFVKPRHTAIYLARTLTNKPYSELAKLFKKKNHASIINACEKTAKLVKLDKNYEEHINLLTSKCKNT